MVLPFVLAIDATPFVAVATVDRVTIGSKTDYVTAFAEYYFRLKL